MGNSRLEKLQRINSLISETDNQYHQASLKIGLSDSASHILYSLYMGNGSCLLRQLYKDTGISKQTVNSALRKLEKEEIVILKQERGKAKIVFLTEKGKRKADGTVSKIVEAELGAFQSWSEDEIDAYITLTKKYMETLRDQVNKL